VADSFDEERRQATPAEGVRILGAEEARAALERERGDEPDDVEAVVVADAPAEPAAARTPGEDDDARFPEAGPTWSAAAAGAVSPPPEAAREPAGEPSGEVPPLPHWTEPPTGAVPAIFADDAGGDEPDELDAWATVSGGQPRFRAEGADWAEADFAQEGLEDDDARLGALAPPAPVDDDEAFAKELEQRRRTPRGRAPRTMVTTPPPARRSPRPRPPDADDSRPAAGAGRDVPTAVATAGVIVVVALICFTQGTFWTALLAAAVVGLATLELTGALRHRGFRPAAPLAVVAAVTLPVAAREYPSGAYPVYFSLVVVFSLLWFLWEVTPGRPLLGVATTVLAFAYVGGLGGFAGLLLSSRDGVGLVIGCVACVVAYDVFGFFVGSQFGKSPIAPRVSPHKTFEGTVAGMAAAVVVGWLVVGGALFDELHPWSPGKGAALGLFVAAAAFVGDLAESMLKRDLGIKDFGSLLPGHGGVLDRFDSLLFCLPVTYFLALHLDIL
jgi:phosphatidate cytidylyltransferase